MSSSPASPITGSITPPPQVMDKFASLRPLVVGAQHRRQEMLHDAGIAAATAKLADGQAPDYLVISCSDSRYAPTQVFNMGPGKIFEKQVVGAIVPPHDGWIRDVGTLGTVRYAVEALKVKHVLVVGHTHCGAVKGILAGAKNAHLCSHAAGRPWQQLNALAAQAEQNPASVPAQAAGWAVNKVLRPAMDLGDIAARRVANRATGYVNEVEELLLLAGPVAARVAQHYGTLAEDQRQRAGSAESALLQREHVLRFPFVQAALASKTLLSVHALVVEVDTRVVNIFDPEQNIYVPLNAPKGGLPPRNP